MFHWRIKTGRGNSSPARLSVDIDVTPYGCRSAQIESGNRSLISCHACFAAFGELPSRKYVAIPRQ